MASRTLAWAVRAFLTFTLTSLGQSQTPTLAHSETQAPAPAQTQKPPVGPSAPQSRHFPVLLLAVGMNPSWSLRVGPNGPERLDRPAYPPILLEPAEIAQEGPNAWVYHAKDTATGAAISVLITREACSDGSATKYSFRAVAQHAQLGTLNGCARIAAELFPRPTNDDDTDDPAAAAKKKQPPLDPTVTGFKMPVDVAYVTSTQKLVWRHGAVPHVVAAEGSQPALSHDGKRLLYTRENKGQTEESAIVLYDSATQKSTDLVTGGAQDAFWSPDDTRFAFLKFADGTWHLWVAPVIAPASATAVFPGTVSPIDGWADAHTILIDDLSQLSWVSDDGRVARTLSDTELYKEPFGNASSGNTVRVHPQNPDLLLVSAEIAKPAAGASAAGKAGSSMGFFLYEIAAKRRVVLSPPDMLATHAEWSHDGLQIFFTGTDASRRTATWRMFWDGTGLKRYVDGRDLVIGQ